MTTTDYTTLAPVLLRLCSTESPRLANPWTRGGWTYFSDGCICARVCTDAEDCVPLHHQRNYPPPNTANVFAGIDSAEPCEIPVVELTPCKDCTNGMRRWQECRNCDGTGDVETVDGAGNVYENECMECDGAGGYFSDHGMLVPCDSCRASGVDWAIFKLGRHSVGSRSFAKAMRLPVVRFGTTNKLIVFWFDGGEGVIAPLSPHEDT